MRNLSFLFFLTILFTNQAASSQCEDFKFIDISSYKSGKPTFFDKSSLLFKNYVKDEPSGIELLSLSFSGAEKDARAYIDSLRNGTVPSYYNIRGLIFNPIDVFAINGIDKKYLDELSEMGFSLSSHVLSSLIEILQPKDFSEYLNKYYDGDPTELAYNLNGTPYSFFNYLLASNKYAQIETYFNNSNLSYLIQSSVYEETLVDLTKFDLARRYWLGNFIDVKEYEKKFAENIVYEQAVYAKQKSLSDEYSHYILFSNCQKAPKTLSSELKHLPSKSQIVREFETLGRDIEEVSLIDLSNNQLSQYAEEYALSVIKHRKKENYKFELIKGEFSSQSVYEKIKAKLDSNRNVIYIDENGISLDEFELLNGIHRQEKRAFPFVELSRVAFYVVKNAPLQQRYIKSVFEEELNSITEFTRNFSFYIHRYSLSEDKLSYFEERLPPPRNHIGIKGVVQKIDE